MNNFKKTLIVGIILSPLTGCWTVAEGQKTGIIVKFSKEGAFVKTYEAEMIRGGFSNGSGANGQSFHFTIEKEDLANKMKEAFENQKEVIIKYHKEAFTGCTRGETSTFLDDIEIIEHKNQ